MKTFDQTLFITNALLLVAVVLAVLGVINTLAALILERTRELALLRVLGMSIAEVRRMLVLESSVLRLACCHVRGVTTRWTRTAEARGRFPIRISP